MTKKRFLGLLSAALGLVLFPRAGHALGQVQYVDSAPRSGSFALVENHRAAPIAVDAGDWPGVVRAAHDLQADVARITGRW
ncbi:MAG: hypothetical protein JO250_11215 [Armatimonadetes bacterium]|nr:hypothetical protein [Armatimonadota bacterium]